MDYKLKPMLFREYDKLTPAEKQEYLQAVIDTFGAVKQNLCEMLDCGKYGFEKSLKADKVKLNYRNGRRFTYEKCCQNEAWIEFIEPVLKSVKKRRGIITKIDCFAYIPTKGKTREKCKALRNLYCRNEVCAFYKTKLDYVRENRRLYGNPEGVDKDYMPRENRGRKKKGQKK